MSKFILLFFAILFNYYVLTLSTNSQPTTTTTTPERYYPEEHSYNFVLINNRRYYILRYVNLRTFQDNGYNVWFHIHYDLIKPDENVKPNDKIFNLANQQIGLVPHLKDSVSNVTYVPVNINEPADISCNWYTARYFRNKKIYLEYEPVELNDIFSAHSTVYSTGQTELGDIFNVNSTVYSTCQIIYSL